MSGEINVTAVIYPKPEKFDEVSRVLFFSSVFSIPVNVEIGGCPRRPSHQECPGARTRHPAILFLPSAGQERNCDR